MFGMSSEEFWEQDPQLYWAYRTFYLKKQELESEKDNQYMWLQGMYIYDAVSVALHNALSKTKVEYPKTPYEPKKAVKIDKNIGVNETVSNKFNSWARLI